MSIRALLCFAFVIGFSIYAYRNWFVSLCAAILLMAVVQHPDMPRNIGDIQGLNPWNSLFLNVFIAWWRQRRLDGHGWDFPRGPMLLLIIYAVTVVAAALRLMLSDGKRWGFPADYVFSEHIVNCLKWVIPGLLLFDGCRSRHRVHIALGVILALYFLLAVQVIRWVPFSAALSSNINKAAARFIQNEIGYNRVTLSMMLGGAGWAALCCLLLVRKRWQQFVVVGIAAAITFGQALTGGRSGYLSWFAVGFVISLLRWRRFLFLIPVAVICIALFLPGVTARFTQGFATKQGNIVEKRDEYEMTSGRNMAWPLVIEEIWKSPFVGFGRQGMTTTGIQARLEQDEGEAFPHPHNAYLEILLDNGLMGFFAIIPFYLLLLGRGLSLLRERNDLLCTAVGGVASALILSLLVASMGGQTFYPREGAVGMWATIGLMLRVWVEREHMRRWGAPMFEHASDESSHTEDQPEPQPA